MAGKNTSAIDDTTCEGRNGNSGMHVATAQLVATDHSDAHCVERFLD